jgi:hypothetical protein
MTGDPRRARRRATVTLWLVLGALSAYVYVVTVIFMESTR